MLFRIIPIPYLKKSLFYKSDSNIEKGDIVSIKIGKKDYFGLVFEVLKENDIKLDFELKDIEGVVIKNFYSEFDFRFFKKFSDYNVVEYTNALSIGIPSYVDKIEKDLSNSKEEIQIKDINLTQKQSEIYEKIDVKNGFKVNLLHGITGSGKTAIYLKIVQDILKSGKQVLILVPQIVLANEIAKNIKKLTNINPIIWHSKITKKNKKIALSILTSNVPGIFIGARSAFLLPYKNLGLIIIDEEHDESYKQSETPIYNARDMSILYSSEKNIPLILASATPSIESMINISRKGFIYHYLDEKFHHNAKDPKIELIKHFPNKDKIFNEKTIFAIKEEIKNSGQCLIFINRRGHTRSVYCKSCKEQPKCENCDNLLSYHKLKNLLKCHYCGHVENFRKVCKKCNSNDIIEYGSPGVEKIKELISKEFENARIAIISSDTINDKNLEGNLIDEIRDGNFDIIIGTEMISKGYHFPNLNLVCILDIETGSFENDVRYNERLFQLLIQLIGRAGRESNSSKVLLQTADISNKVLKFVLNNDLHGFYKFEIENRKKFKLPPFSSFICLTIFSERDEIALQTANHIKNDLSSSLSSIKEILIFGPSEAQVKYMKRFYRYKILLQFPKDKNLTSIIKTKLKKIDIKTQKAFIKIDVDPYFI